MTNPSSNATRRTFPRERTRAGLPEPLNQRLSAYALAAGAAGVAALACTVPADAAPVCGSPLAQILSTGTFPLNPTGQFAPPFNVAQTTYSYVGSTTSVNNSLWWNRGFFVANSAAAKVLLGPKNLPADVTPGAEIGPGGQFGKGSSYGLMFTYGKADPGSGTLLKHRGNFNLLHTNYIGFQFSQSGKVHYGWARLAVTFRNTAQFKHTVLHILAFGYESTPNAAIAAGSCSAAEQANSDGPQNAGHDIAKNGSPTAMAASERVVGDSDTHNASSLDFRGASLGMLAVGSEGIPKWRKPPF